MGSIYPDSLVRYTDAHAHQVVQRTKCHAQSQTSLNLILEKMVPPDRLVELNAGH